MDKRNQRIGSKSNSHVGREFERKVHEFFQRDGLELSFGYSIEIGIIRLKKHAFDLGNGDKQVLVECKAHTWTEGGNVPSAKLTAWNQAMFYFYVAPSGYRKIMFVQKDFSQRRNESLGAYYLRTYAHLVPTDVEFWEFNESDNSAERLR